MPSSPFIDVLPAGVLVHRGGTVVYANDALCAIVGRARGEVVGRPFGDLLPPEEARRLVDSAARRARGEPVPDTWQSVPVRVPDGSRREVEVTVRYTGEEYVCLVRDVTGAAGRRALRHRLSHLGVTIQACRTEADVMRTLREGVAAVGLSGAWLVPDGDDRLRVEYADLPGDWFERAMGRPVAGFTGAWTPWFRRAWAEGEAYSDDAIAEVARFVGHPWDAAVGDVAAASGMTRAVALRVDDEGEARAVLVLRGPWLHPDDLAVAHLLRAQLSAALSGARYIATAHRRMRDLEAVNALARRALAEAQGSPGRVLDAALEVARETLGAPATAAFLLEPAGATLALHGPAPGHDRVAYRLADEPLAREALAGDAPVRVDDLSTDPRVSRAARARGVAGSALITGLSSKRGPRGVLAAHDPAGRRFSDEDAALLRAMASVTEVGLEGAEANEALRERLGELRVAQGKLVERERLAALGEVAAVVAHEVRNPLGVIFNAVSGLRRVVPPDGDGAALLEMVREEAGRLNQIVGDLLDFARPAAPVRAPAALGPLVEGALAAALARASAAQDASRVATEVDVPDELPPALVDPRLARQALLNVMLNALEAMPGGGTLRVEARALPEARRLRVSVRDTGPGIPEEARRRVFEPFFTTRASGTGLGLAVVKRIVEAHDGEVSVGDAPGGGAEFTMLWPMGE